MTAYPRIHRWPGLIRLSGHGEGLGSPQEAAARRGCQRAEEPPMNNVPYGLGAKRPEPVLPCTGACRGDRPAWDEPARFGRMPDGTRTIFCTCCMHVLTPVEALAPAPNLASSIDPAGAKRWECQPCGYDTVVLKELKAKA